MKPASTTPLTATRIVELLNQAGLPKGVLNITLDGAEKLIEGFFDLQVTMTCPGSRVGSPRFWWLWEVTGSIPPLEISAIGQTVTVLVTGMAWRIASLSTVLRHFRPKTWNPTQVFGKQLVQ